MPEFFPSIQHLHRGLMLIMLLVLGACAMQPKTPLSLQEKVAQLQAEFKFGAAERAINNADPELYDPDTKQQLLQSNTSAARAYEKRIIGEVAKLQDQQQWGEALARSRSALSAYPESDKLNEHSNTLFLARDQFLRKKLLAHRLLRAKRIPAERDNLRALADASAEARFIDRYQQLNAEADEIAEALLTEGQRRIAKKQWRSAREVLQLSQALREDERTSTALRVAKSNIKPKRRPKPKPAAKPIKVEPVIDTAAVEAALHRYRYAMQQQDLLAAQKHLSEAKQLNPDDAEIQRESKRLNATISTTVEQRVEQGKYQYSLGDIDKAIDHWEFALQLTPDDQALKERLQRARRFRDRYEQLKR